MGGSLLKTLCVSQRLIGSLRTLPTGAMCRGLHGHVWQGSFSVLLGDPWTILECLRWPLLFSRPENISFSLENLIPCAPVSACPTAGMLLPRFYGCSYPCTRGTLGLQLTCLSPQGDSQPIEQGRVFAQLHSQQLTNSISFVRRKHTHDINFLFSFLSGGYM